MPAVIYPNAQNVNQVSVLWDNKLSRGTLSSSGVASGYPAINAVRDAGTASSWKPSAAGGYIQVDLGAASRVDTVGIAAHNLATNGASVVLRGSSNGTSWTDIVSHSPLTDDDIILYFQSANYRYYRVVILGAVANIGVAFAGEKLAFPHSPLAGYKPLHHSRKYSKKFTETLGGHLIQNYVTAGAADTSVDLWLLSRPWVNSVMRGFEIHYAQGGTFFYAGQPLTDPMDIGYCSADSQDAIVDVAYDEGPDLASVSFGVRAYVG